MPDQDSSKTAEAATPMLAKAALTAIVKHGYMSTRYSTAADFQRSMDWMLDTADAALAGAPLPPLDPEETGQ